jgi:hypothetical protein
VCEHVIPCVVGAGSSAAELAWACPACNGHKYAKTHARDPQTGRIVPLFNPRPRRWSRNFVWSQGLRLIEARTGTGRATIAALHLNYPALVNLRRALVASTPYSIGIFPGPAQWFVGINNTDTGQAVTVSFTVDDITGIA